MALQGEAAVRVRGLVLVLALAALSCDGGVSLRGRVMDGAGAPIEGAMVRVSRQGYYGEARTAESGCLEIFGVVAPGRYSFSVVVEAPGRKALTTEIETLDSYHCEFVLVPETSEARSASECETNLDLAGWERQCPEPVLGGVEWN